MDERANKRVIEEGARAVHETYYGAGTWKSAGAESRSQARQAVRKLLASFEKNAVKVEGKNGAAATTPPTPRRAPPPTPPRRF